MAKYLCIVTYIAEGLKGLMAKGGTARVEAARKSVANASGSVDGFYFALGADDAYADLPDIAAAAAAMSAATGMVVNRMVPLLTAEEVDRAAAARLSYDAPGS